LAQYVIVQLLRSILAMIPRRKLKLATLIAVAAVCTAGATFAYLTDGIRWRIGVVAMKASGQIQDIGWRQLMSMMKPGSDFYLAGLLETPNPYLVIRNPFTSERDLTNGKQLFLGHCALCHGDLGEGKNAPSLVGRSLRIGDSDWAVYRAMTGGVKDLSMPPVSLPQEEAWQTIAYVQALRHEESEAEEKAAASTPSAIPVDVSAQRIANAAAEPANWLTYSGSYSSWRYTALNEINAGNVADLKLAWSLQLDVRQPVESSPIVVDGVMYATAPPSDVLAIDAATGDVRWRYRRPMPAGVPACCGTVNRGVAVLDDRVYIGTLDGYLVALNAQTGHVLWQTQIADYRESYTVTVAPLAIPGRIIVGVSGGEYGIRGFVDAYDAKTGARAWRFYTIPRAGDRGAETWEHGSWTNGGGPTWVTGSFDPELGLVYWGVGNPSPDYNGVNRPGDNLFTNSIVALHADTGELAWYFQFTPHDEHDWDSNQVPVLLDKEIDGQPRHLLLSANRNGFFYVLDRKTGEFLRGTAFVKQTWAERIDEKGRPVVIPNSAPSAQGTLTWPGVNGGANWWSPSYSPVTGLVYVPLAESPTVYYKGASSPDEERSHGGLVVGSSAEESSLPFRGGVRALDPRTSQTIWEYLGAPRTGATIMGGTLASAGNLVFLGDSNAFLAVAADTGRQLWRINLGGTLHAAPISYAVGGRQYITVAAGNTFFAFRL
jgi:alcohol dehydrogenase (cytochrome c)